MLNKDRYDSLSADSHECASDDEQEQHPLTSSNVHSPQSVSGPRHRYMHVLLAVLAQLVYTGVVLFAAREFHYKRVTPVVAAPDRYHAWVSSLRET